MMELPLSPDGQSIRNVDLDGTIADLTTQYNYSAECWSLNIIDSAGDAILTGLKLVPNIDILRPHPTAKSLIGSLVLVEKNVGDYKSPDLLGINTALLWFSVDEETGI